MDQEAELCCQEIAVLVHFFALAQRRDPYAASPELLQAAYDCDAPTAVLAHHLQCSPETITVGYCADVYEASDAPGEYLVVDESGRDLAADRSLDSYLVDCVLAECPSWAHFYFDDEAWKRDQLLADGYGSLLATYDCHEYEYTIDGEWYYVYRVG